LFFAVSIDDALESVAFALSPFVQINEAVVTLIKGTAAFQALKAGYFTFASRTINLSGKANRFAHSIQALLGRPEHGSFKRIRSTA
jgi:hypothetical protein